MDTYQKNKKKFIRKQNTYSVLRETVKVEKRIRPQLYQADADTSRSKL